MPHADELWIPIVLALAALAAGAVNSIAGGGTLLTFPALMGVGLDPLWANATSTVALMPGSLAGSFGYRKQLRQCGRLLAILIGPSLIGGYIGVRLVVAYPGVFNGLVPWLILTASVLFLLQAPLKKLVRPQTDGRLSTATIVGVICGQFLIAVYGGYFGAGIGILMLSVLPFMGTTDIHQTNGAKTFLASLINGITVVVFIGEGKVHWNFAAVMVVAAVIGGYVGSKLALRLSAAKVRLIVVLIGFTLSAYYMWKQFA